MRLESLGIEFWVIVGLMVLSVALLSSFMASLYRKAGPHEALIVYGFRGTRIVKGHGTVIFPMVEMFHQLSLELMSFDVAPMQDLYTKQGVAVTVEAVAQIKVKSDLESIQTAAEQFLTKTPDQRESLIRLVMEGHLRGIIDRELADDAAQVAFHHETDQALALVRGLGEELLRGRLDRFEIGLHLDLRDGFDRHRDTLLRVQVLHRRDIE